MTNQEDPTSIELVLYETNYKGLFVKVRGKELGYPEYRVEVLKHVYGPFHELAGCTQSMTIQVWHVESNELVVNLFTRV